MTYLLTFSCYGTHVHGQEGGTVDRHNNCPGTRLLGENPGLAHYERGVMLGPPYSLDVQRRRVVLEAIKETARYRRWRLVALHVRSTHVHVVVEAHRPPEFVMNSFKAYASRALNRLEDTRPRWARHGSTRYLRDDDSVRAAVAYVLDSQGDPMEWWMEPQA